jgi:methionyl-tRNA formyltransferase
VKLSILCSDSEHPIVKHLCGWVSINRAAHDIKMVNSSSDLEGGDLLFLVSCSEIVTEKVKEKYGKTLVIHASNLPVGRGWSPLIWQVLAGQQEIVVSLLEAGQRVDTGDIWAQEVIRIPATALHDEINEILFQVELKLLDYAVANAEVVEPRRQDPNTKPTYFERRTPAHSEIDAFRSIAEQFDLIRVCDPKRYPAFFYYKGEKFMITVEKVDVE